VKVSAVLQAGTAGCDAPTAFRGRLHREFLELPAGVRVVGLSLTVVACAALAFALWRPVQVVPLLHPAPLLTFRDANGFPVTSAGLDGTIVLLQFSALRCAAPCPDGHAALQAIQRRFDASPPPVPVRLVTVVLDAGATSAALRARETAMGAAPRWWRAAAGDARALKNAIGAGFGVYYTADAAGRVAFEPATILVDGRGIVRAEYRTASPDVRRLARDLDLVVREAASRGPVRAAYAAAHLFLCYPR